MNKIYIGILLLIHSALCVASQNESTSISATINVLENNKWGWSVEEAESKCTDNPHTWKFNLKKNEAWSYLEKSIPVDSFTSKSDGKSFRYIILSWSSDRILMKLDGEKRKTNEGKLVVWELWLADNSTYAWHRTDWPANNYTSPIKKCHANKANQH